MLFTLMMNDLYVKQNEGVHTGDLEIRTLVYADDIVIMTKYPEVLQGMINRLEYYCSRWNLVINLCKSKIIVIRREVVGESIISTSFLCGGPSFAHTVFWLTLEDVSIWRKILGGGVLDVFLIFLQFL